MGSNPHANGGSCCSRCRCRISTTTPSPCPGGRGPCRGHACSAGPARRDETQHGQAEFPPLRPDETASNRLQAVYEVSGKEWMAEVEAVDINLSPDGG